MATTIKLKNSVTTTNAPSSLVQGEVAINITDKKVWVGNAATTPIQLLGDGGSASFTSIAFGAGTVSNPSITFTGDTNTGIYSPAADTIAFTEGGVESMRIDSSGNVGIGVTATTQKLWVNGNTCVPNDSFFGFHSNPSAGGISNYYSGNDTSNYLRMFTGGSERMRIDSSGNVGIGTSSPSQRLDVVGDARVSNTTGNKRFYLGQSTPSANDGGSIEFQNSNSQINWAIRTNFNVAGALEFCPSTVAGGVSYTTPSMVVTNSGNVGIGTSSPSGRLHVATTTNTSVYAAADAGYSLFRGVTNSSGGVLSITGNSTGNGINFTVYNAALNGYEPANYNGSIQVFKTSNTERMRITAGGEVYIAGTTDQGAYNLQCNGTGVWGAGAYVNGSDKRIKDNIAPLDSGLDVVAKLNPVTYKYKENWSKDQSTQTGFIAQELLTALDGKNYVDGVVQQGGEYMSVAYQNIIPILTKAIQEQQAMIVELTNRIKKLEGV